MNGAESIIQSARSCGIDVCFANPGTTEIPLVAALDVVGGIRPVLCLFEGVCTGAADGYARMLDKPAMVLLHLGVGLANGTSNLHNARRAHTPIVVVVGEHATWHRPLDPPLAMNIESIASTTSGRPRTCSPDSFLGRDMTDAVSSALEGQVSILIVPYDLQMKRCEEKLITLTAPYQEEVDHAKNPAKPSEFWAPAPGQPLCLVAGYSGKIGSWLPCASDPYVDVTFCPRVFPPGWSGVQQACPMSPAYPIYPSLRWSFCHTTMHWSSQGPVSPYHSSVMPVCRAACQ